ncbi:MAG: hypothetical protein RH946_00540 [Rhodospirillales bacterium]
MSKANFSDDFKRDAVRQITERGFFVFFSGIGPVLALFHGRAPLSRFRGFSRDCRESLSIVAAALSDR